MVDNSDTEGGKPREDPEGGQESGGSLEQEVREGTGDGTDGDNYLSSALLSDPGSLAGERSDQDGLNEEFRFVLLEAIRAEESPQVREMLASILGKELDWKGQLDDKEIDVAKEWRVESIKVKRENLQAGRSELRHASWRQTAMWAAPAVLAFLLVIFLFLFLKWQMNSAASTVKEILVLLMTGTLGWAAGRRSSE